MEKLTALFRKKQKYRYELPITLYVDGNLMNDEYSFSLQSLALQEFAKIEKFSQNPLQKSITSILNIFYQFLCIFTTTFEYFTSFIKEQTTPKIKIDSDLNDHYDKNQKKYILVLDLDETLIHADQKKDQKEDFKVQVFINNIIETFYVKKRPFLNEFLEQMSEIFELVVYTASIKQYADQVIDLIDPKKLIKRKLYRNDCLRMNNTYYKDLQKVELNLEKVCIIDNSQSGFYLNKENGMLIKSWYSDQNDNELLTYARFLKEIATKHYYIDIRKNISFLKRQYPENIINQ